MTVAEDTEKKFVIKHVFNDVMRQLIEKEAGTEMSSPVEEHFGVEWKLRLFRNSNDYIDFHLDCLCKETISDWSIETDSKVFLKGKNHWRSKNNTFSKNRLFSDASAWIHEDTYSDHSTDDSIPVEFHVKIKNMTGNFEKKGNLYPVLVIDGDDLETKVQKFVYKETFVGFPLRDNYSYIGKKETHFDVPWRAYIYTASGYLHVHLQSRKFAPPNDYNIQTNVQLKLLRASGPELISEKNVHFSKSEDDHEIWKRQIDQSLDHLLLDGELILEFHVEIKTSSGIERKKLRNFDKEKFSDAVLRLGNDKFYVLKKFLASQSPYFEDLLLEKPEKHEFNIHGFNRWDFHNFLELIHGESVLDDDTVDGILLIAYTSKSDSAVQKCHKFLMENSEKPMKFKLELALNFELDELKNACLSSMKTIEDVRSVIKKISKIEENSIWKELLLKALEFR